MAATGSGVQLFDSNFALIETGNRAGVEQDICPHCTGAMNCRKLHINAFRESGRQGKPFVYQCETGLMFWTCPVFSENKYSGALRGSGYVSDKTDASSFAAKCNGTIPPEEFARRISVLPTCGEDKVVSLAEMLLLCAESVSSGSQKYHDTLRIRGEQTAALSSQLEGLKEKYPEGSSPLGYPVDKERQLFDALRKGDKKEAEKLLNEVFAILVFSNPDNFRNIQYRALELAVLLTRSSANYGNTGMENSTRYLKRVQEAKTVEDLTSILHDIVENITGQIALFRGIPHASAMMKAEQFIRENFTRKISLREISRVAGLSAPYFSTIFKEEMGENFSSYINRLRVEKAAKLLLETDLSLSDISAACCFEDQSWFSKIFKAFTGISPGKYRSRSGTAQRLV
jgi:YesN/AraC family two-component response regulator